MNVTNRKMFRPRNARNKLNQMGGIMASSPELMQTIQRFELGGGVNVRPGARPTVMGMGSGDLPNVSQIMDFLGVSSLVPGGQATPADQVFNQGVETFADTQRPVNLYDPSGRIGFEGNRFNTGTFTEEEARRIAASRAQPAQAQMYPEPPTLPGVLDYQLPPAAMTAPFEVPQTMENPLLGDSFVFGASAPSGDQITTMGLEEPATMAREPEAAVPQEPPAAPQEPAAAPQVPSTPEVEAAKRGELGPKAQVQAVIAAGTPEERQDQLTQLMNEFTSKAPKYEGLDKGMALAKIGFAMAAGKSPRALENIANALNQGADMFIKDKQERNAFNRQVQLSALQYGLTEVGKERAEARLAEREGRKPNYFYAGEPLEYNGVSYDKDDIVVISTQDIRENGVPKGLVTPERIKALTEREVAISKALNDAAKEKVLKPSDARAEAEAYQSSVKNVIGTEVAVGLLENSLVDVAEGKVTGLAPAFRDIVRQGANFFGIDPGTEYKGLAEARAGMRSALQKAVPVTVGSTQSANSISDRDVDLLITALFGENALTGGPFTFVTEDPELMGQRLQRAIQEMRNGQRSELAAMQSVETRLSDMYAPGSTLTSPRPATAVIAPFQQQFREAGFGDTRQPSRTQAGLVRGEDGIFRFQ